LEKVVNHFATSSFFAGNEKERKIFSYLVERLNYERMESCDSLLAVGQVRVTSEIIPEPEDFLFGLFLSKKEVCRTWVLENKNSFRFDRLKEKCFESFGKKEEAITQCLTSFLGDHIFTIRDTFKEERQAVFQKFIEDELNEHRRIYAELFDKSKEAVAALAREGVEIPFEIRVAAEVTLSHRLLKGVERLKGDYKSTTEKGEIDRIVDEAKKSGYHLRKEEPLLILDGMLREKVGLLRTPEDSSIMEERIEEIITFLARVEKWGFEISKDEAQDLMDEMLKEYVGGLEKSWWGNGSEKPFPPNLILLAEKLDFNVERFSKMVNPAASTPRS
jgi:hypothetical protein